MSRWRDSRTDFAERRGRGIFAAWPRSSSSCFNIVQPDVAYFGQKDAQQARIIQQMVRDLDLPIRLRICPIVREPDGLALSSRNRYLDPEQRRQALALSQALAEAAVPDRVRASATRP